MKNDRVKRLSNTTIFKAWITKLVSLTMDAIEALNRGEMDQFKKHSDKMRGMLSPVKSKILFNRIEEAIGEDGRKKIIDYRDMIIEQIVRINRL